jgi:hypothetical protein
MRYHFIQIFNFKSIKKQITNEFQNGKISYLFHSNILPSFAILNVFNIQALDKAVFILFWFLRPNYKVFHLVCPNRLGPLFI